MGSEATRGAFGRWGLVVALALPVAAPCLADTYPRQPGLDVVHYAFRLTLSDETDAIQAEAVVDIRVLEHGVETLVLDLVAPSHNTPGQGMEVSGVTEEGAPARFEHTGERLQIALDPPGQKGERRRVVVRYGGVPATGLVIAPNKYGDRTFFSDNWPTRARHWLPTVDHPHDKATSEFVVTAPAHYQVVSNGLLVEETDTADGRRRTHWRQSVPISPWLYVLGVARFAVDHRPPWRGVPIETWVYPQDRQTGFEVFAEPTVAVLDFLADRVGPYPYERLAHIQSNSVRGGMEAATSILYGDDSASGERRDRWRNVIIHEIAHQWFGNGVTESDWDHVWLSEGFATYFTHLFIEHASGRDVLLARLQADRDVIREFDGEHPDYRILHDELSDMRRVVTNAGTYKKGAWILHMLRGVVGDAAFWEGVREYYRTHRNGTATTSDFRRAMEDASGQELGRFFDQWLTRGGMLDVRGTWSYDPKAGELVVELTQRQAGDPFEMPLEVGIELAGEPLPRLARIELTAREGRFAVPLDAEPTSVELDPRTWLLMDGVIERTPE